MAVTLRKPKPKLDTTGSPIDEGALYAAVTSFCAGPDGRLVVREGDTLRGRDDAVQAASTLFLRQPCTAGEIAQARHKIWPDSP